MKLYFYKSRLGNFGDDINKWLWNDLLPGFFDDNEDVRFSAIGTIISPEMPKAKKWIVFGSGIGYGFPPAGFGDASWDIKCVRGPLSANVLGLQKHQYITDGAAFLHSHPEFTPLPESERSGVIFIPHHKALAHGQWENVCKMAGVTYIDPRTEAKEVINKIRHAKLVLADAMHAAIIADAMRVPWVPMVTSTEISTFKWLDWAQTIDTPYMPTVLGGEYATNALRKSGVMYHGSNQSVKGRDVEYAINDFKYRIQLKSSTGLQRHIDKIRYISLRLPEKVVRSKEDKINSSWDAAMVEQVAKKLEVAKNRQGFLSDDAIFANNLSRLHEQLQIVKNTVW
ncbi:exosortase [Erwinia typographi]|uniref:Exosortase n=1 Tax=Erwinia typographi TaxID=371042 RepID=A0A0A3Z9R7_9GAMM|nr:polysaccharide pyruvyl transferase family protein [Erwinia typographi]KGT95837.1 exosortase [Erwinia typographi]